MKVKSPVNQRVRNALTAGCVRLESMTVRIDYSFNKGGDVWARFAENRDHDAFALVDEKTRAVLCILRQGDQGWWAQRIAESVAEEKRLRSTIFRTGSTLSECIYQVLLCIAGERLRGRG